MALQSAIEDRQPKMPEKIGESLSDLGDLQREVAQLV
jgi:hypothetical protein